MRHSIMKQLQSKEDELIKRFLANKLLPNKYEILNNHKSIYKQIHEQWEQTPENSTDRKQEARILKRILNRIEGSSKNEKHIHRYAWVGTVVLLLLCGTLMTFLVRPPSQEVLYVFNSGRQSMDSVYLPDGTFVMLNAGTKLIYPKKFTGKKREVFLTGQAFFTVYPDSKRPFIVKTTHMNVTALGTAFEVFSNDDISQTETTLLNGKIEITLPDHSKKEHLKYILHPNEKLTYNAKEGVKTEAVNADSYSQWRNGKGLVFKDEKLSMILPRLEKWYGKKIECSPETAAYYHFTFTIQDEPIELILNIMTQHTPLTYKLKNDDGYILSKKVP